MNENEDDVRYFEPDSRKRSTGTYPSYDQTGLLPTEYESVQTVQHPWRRLFARTLDLALYGLIWTALWNGILHVHPDYSTTQSFIDSFIALGLMLIIEPLLLSKFGSTLGKLVFGLSLIAKEGRKLSYLQALHRTWGVFRYGLGLNIPIYDLVRGYKSYKACSDGKQLPWEEDETYAIRDTKIFRGVIFLAAEGLIVLCSIILNFNAELPIHRGDINTAEFVENFNDYLDYYGADYGEYLGTDGKWIDAQDTNALYFNLSDFPLPDFEISETDGVVTKVSFEVEADNASIIEDYRAEMLIAVMSYVGAQNEMNGIRLKTSGIIDQITSSSFSDFSFAEAGIKVSCAVECSGFLTSTSGILFSEENEDTYFHLIFIMEQV